MRRFVNPHISRIALLRNAPIPCTVDDIGLLGAGCRCIPRNLAACPGITFAGRRPLATTIAPPATTAPPPSPPLASPILVCLRGGIGS